MILEVFSDLNDSVNLYSPPSSAGNTTELPQPLLLPSRSAVAAGLRTAPSLFGSVSLVGQTPDCCLGCCWFLSAALNSPTHRDLPAPRCNPVGVIDSKHCPMHTENSKEEHFYKKLTRFLRQTPTALTVPALLTTITAPLRGS